MPMTECYGHMLRAVMEHLSRTGLILMIAGAAFCVLSAVLWIVSAAARSRRQAAAAVSGGGDPLTAPSADLL